MTVCPMGQLKASGAGALPLDPGGDAGSVAPDQGRPGVVPDTLPSRCTRGGDEPRRAWNEGGGDGGGEGRVAPTPAPTPAPASGEAAPTLLAGSGSTAGSMAAASSRDPGAPTMWTTSARAASWRAARVGDAGRAPTPTPASAMSPAPAMSLAEVLLTRRRPEKAAGAAGGAVRLSEERPAPEAYRLSTSVRWLGVGVGVGEELGSGSR